MKHFEHYCAYKGYPEGKQLALCKVLLTENAAIWLDTSDEIDSMQVLKRNLTNVTRLQKSLSISRQKRSFYVDRGKTSVQTIIYRT